MAQNMLDLHGCRVEEVADKVDRFLVRAMEANLDKIRIVTGKGKGLVQKETIRYLKLGNYPWTYEKLPNGKPNEGVLVIRL